MAVLFIVLVISLLVGSITTHSRYQLKYFGHEMRRSQEQFVLRGAATDMSYLFRNVWQNSDREKIIRSGWRDCVHVSGRTIAVRFLDHDGMIDLNTASEDLLGLGFEALAIPKAQAKYVAQRVIDFRDRDWVDAEQNPEMSHYENLGVKNVFGNKNSRIENVLELDQLPQFQISRYPGVYNTFTVHSGLSGLSISTAPEHLIHQIAGTIPGNRTSREAHYSVEIVLPGTDAETPVFHQAFTVLGFDGSPGTHPAPGFVYRTLGGDGSFSVEKTDQPCHDLRMGG